MLEADEGHPQEPVACAQPDALPPFSLENSELVPQSQDLD